MMAATLSPFEYRLIRYGGCLAEIVNPYTSCGYECRYCYCREVRQQVRKQFRIKSPADAALRWLHFSELLTANKTCQYAFVGTAVDPYPPWEPELAVTRQILVECARFQRRIVLATKSTLVLRDADVLRESPTPFVFMSLASLSPHWHRSWEPKSALPQERLRTIEAIAKKGVDVAVFVAPVLPGQNDDVESLGEVLKAATFSGARLCVIGLGIGPTPGIAQMPTASWREELSQRLSILCQDCAFHPDIAEYTRQRLGPFGQASLDFPDPRYGLAILKNAAIPDFDG